MADASLPDRVEAARDSLISARRAYVAEYLRARAKDAGVSQVMLAERLEVTPGRVSQILSGDENLTVDTITAVLAAVGVKFALAAAEGCQFRGRTPRGRGMRGQWITTMGERSPSSVRVPWQTRNVPHSIPEGVARLAYEQYANQYGTDQSFERLHERGGFGVLELVGLLADLVERERAERGDVHREERT